MNALKWILVVGGCCLVLVLAYRLGDDTDSSVSNYDQHSHDEMRQAAREAFAGSGEAPTGIEADEVEEFFARFGEAIRAEEPLDPKKFITVEGMYDSLVSSGALSDLSSREKKQVKMGMEVGINQSFSANMKAMSYDSFLIRRLDTIDADERLVYVQFNDNELAVSFKMRFWLLKTADGLRIYDYEDMDIGLRAIEMMGLVMSALNKPVPDPWVQDMLACKNELQRMDGTTESYARLKAPLLDLRRHPLPTMIKRFASGMLASCHIVLGDADLAIQELEEAKKGGYDTPMHLYQLASAKKLKGEAEEALKDFQTHAEEYGWDFDLRELCAECLIDLSRHDEAAEMVREALKENPESLVSHCILVSCLKPEEMADQAHGLIEKSGSPLELYEYALDYLILLEDKPRAEALNAVFKQQFPDSDLHEYYGEVIPAIGQEPEVEE